MMSIKEIFDKMFKAELSREEWQNLLASNAVLEWFGKTFRGKKEISTFYAASNLIYKHFMKSPKEIPPFESRPTHLSTRTEPVENFEQPFPQNDDCQYDYEEDAHSSINMSVKDSLYQTPPHRANSFIECPPAPNRKSFLNSSLEQSQDLYSDESDNEEGEYVSGIRPLDSHSTVHLQKKSKKHYRKEIKRQKLQQTTSDAVSNYSELSYIKLNGEVLIRSSSLVSPIDDQEDRREADLFISYRTRKDNPNDIQIALLVYRSLNTKPRRNLAQEFLEETPTEEATITLNTPTAVISQSTVESNNQLNNSITEIFTPSTDMGVQSRRIVKKAIKRRGCLRF